MSLGSTDKLASKFGGFCYESSKPILISISGRTSCLCLCFGESFTKYRVIAGHKLMNTQTATQEFVIKSINKLKQSP